MGTNTISKLAKQARDAARIVSDHNRIIRDLADGCITTEATRSRLKSQLAEIDTLRRDVARLREELL